jgi:PAS domain S-box-containing protein
VEHYQDELQAIRVILKAHPKGMTVTDIARETKTNRNSIAKYLDILLITGHADMLTFGPAKVYFPSTRLPIGSLIDVNPDGIILLNKDLRIIQTNTTLLTLLDVTRTELLGNPIATTADTLLNLPDLSTSAQTALAGKETTLSCDYTHHNHHYTLQIRAVPTTFDDGQPGVTLILTNATTTKNLHTQLQHQTTIWQTTVDHLTDMILLIDNDHNISRINTATATYLGLTPDQCLGHKCYELLHHTTQPPTTCLCPSLKTTKQAARQTFTAPNNGHTIDILAAPLLTPTGDYDGAIHIIKTKKTN